MPGFGFHYTTTGKYNQITSSDGKTTVTRSGDKLIVTTNGKQQELSLYRGGGETDITIPSGYDRGMIREAGELLGLDAAHIRFTTIPSPLPSPLPTLAPEYNSTELYVAEMPANGGCGDGGHLAKFISDF